MTGLVLFLVAFAAVSSAAVTPITTGWPPARCRKSASGGIACLPNLDASTSFTDYDFDYLFNLLYPGSGFDRFGTSYDDLILNMIEGYPRLGYGGDFVSRNVAYSKGNHEFAQYLPINRGFGYDACRRNVAFSDCDNCMSPYYPKEIRYCCRGTGQGYADYADCCECGSGGCCCGGGGGCCCCCAGGSGRIKSLNGDCFSSGYYGGRISCPC